MFAYTARRALSTVLLATTILSSQAWPAQAAPAKILVQIDTYEGKAAYFALYLVSPEGRYEQTLWVSGKEAKWYPDLPRWWKYLARKPQTLDAITGASTASGDRSVVDIEIADGYLDAGYKLRVETAVEEKENHASDIEAELAKANIGKKLAGSGYVRFIQFKY